MWTIYNEIISASSASMSNVEFRQMLGRIRACKNV